MRYSNRDPGHNEGNKMTRSSKNLDLKELPNRTKIALYPTNGTKAYVVMLQEDMPQYPVVRHVTLVSTPDGPFRDPDLHTEMAPSDLRPNCEVKLCVRNSLDDKTGQVAYFRFTLARAEVLGVVPEPPVQKRTGLDLRRITPADRVTIALETLLGKVTLAVKRNAAGYFTIVQISSNEYPLGLGAFIGKDVARLNQSKMATLSNRELKIQGIVRHIALQSGYYSHQ